MFSNNLRRGKTLIYFLSLYGLASKYFHEKGFLKIHNLLILFQVAAAVSCFPVRPWFPLSHAVDFLGADQAVCKQGRKNEGSACSVISFSGQKPREVRSLVHSPNTTSNSVPIFIFLFSPK